MAAIALPPPKILKRIFELAGYRCVLEDSYCWTMESNSQVIPIPKHGKLVTREPFETALDSAQMNNKDYFDHLKIAEQESGR